MIWKTSFVLISLLSLASCETQNTQTVSPTSGEGTPPVQLLEVTNADNPKVCQDPSKEVSPSASAVSENIQPVNLSGTDLNSFAKFLAGNKGIEGWENIQKTASYSKYKDTLISSWNHFHNKNFNQLIEWQKAEVATIMPQTYNVFYPFSGPDVLHVMAFYPNANEYVFVGQEAIGDIQKLFSSCQNQAIYATRLSAINKGIDSLLRRSFFVTADMMYQVSRSELGVVPFIMLQLSKLGFEIKAVNKVSNHRVEIEFAKDTRVSKITYLRVDLSNHVNKGEGEESVGINKELSEKLKALGDYFTLIKSASYLLHSDSFSALRTYVLSTSQMVIQDDSGIPYRSFKKADWEVSPYGAYTKPYGTFGAMQHLTQKDLQEAFKQAKGMPFRLGYGYSKVPSNIVIAKNPKLFKSSESSNSNQTEDAGKTSLPNHFL